MKLVVGLLLFAATQQHRPAGWDRGNKAGWEGDYPPGWTKKSSAQREGFLLQYNAARTELRLHLKGHKKSRFSADAGCSLLLKGVNAGLEISVALDLCKTSADHGLSGADCGIALRSCSRVHGSGIPHGEVGAFVKSRIRAGVRGEFLASSIHGELERRKGNKKGPGVKGASGGPKADGRKPARPSSSGEEGKGKGKGKGKKKK